MAIEQITGLGPPTGADPTGRSQLPDLVADFEPQTMVAWFAPSQLLRTAFRAAFASAITGYVDRRETQAALPRGAPKAERTPPGIDLDLSNLAGKQEVWIDYIADLGDGWNPSYTMSLLLAKPRLRIKGLKDETLQDAVVTDAGLGGKLDRDDELPRADVLILGGDLVYPTPSREGYTDRLQAPLACAFPPRKPGASALTQPSLFAIPGNHDWYDGLTDFLRVFCQRAAIGGWRTRQSRSYFALRLPHRWSLWGIDIQLETRIDPVQMAHFTSISAADQKEGGRNVILCTAEPSWLEGLTGREKSYKNLMHFEAQVTRPAIKPTLPPVNAGGNGAHQPGRGRSRPEAPRLSIPVTLAGDQHHYARYLEHEHNPSLVGVDEDRDKSGDQPRHRITCGSGGAYLLGTHWLPTRIARPKRVSQRRLRLRGRTRSDDGLLAANPSGPSEGELIAAGVPYPSRSESRRLALGALRLPLMRHNWSFCVFVGSIYVILAAAFGMARRGPDLSLNLDRWRDYFPPLLPNWDQVGRILAQVEYLWKGNWGLFVLVAAVLWLTAEFALLFNREREPRWAITLWGGLHGVIHVGMALALAWGISRLARERLLIADVWHAPTVYALTFFVGAIVGGFVMGGYLLLSSLYFRLHTNEVFSVQSIQDYRSFLRIRIDREGVLTIYPIGLRSVPRKWRRRHHRREAEPHFDPADDSDPEPHLIEAPIRVPRPARCARRPRRSARLYLGARRRRVARLSKQDRLV